MNMKAVVVNYRGSHKRHNTHQMILQPVGVESKDEATKLIGKKAIWTSPAGKKLEGKISAVHGIKGCVRALFAEAGLPGQSIGQQVEIE